MKKVSARRAGAGRVSSAQLLEIQSGQIRQSKAKSGRWSVGRQCPCKCKPNGNVQWTVKTLTGLECETSQHNLTLLASFNEVSDSLGNFSYTAVRCPLSSSPRSFLFLGFSAVPKDSAAFARTLPDNAKTRDTE